MVAGQSKAQARSKRVQEIVSSARVAFAQKGFYQTSIRDIAKEAGIKSPSILHYHFENKEQIFLAVVDDTCNEIAQAARARVNPRSRDAVLDALDALWEELDKHPEITPLLVEFCSTALRDESGKVLMAAFLERMRRLIVETLEQSLGRAIHLLPIDKNVLAALVLNIIEGHAIHCALQGVTPLCLEQRRSLRTLLTMVGNL